MGNGFYWRMLPLLVHRHATLDEYLSCELPGDFIIHHRRLLLPVSLTDYVFRSVTALSVSLRAAVDASSYSPHDHENNANINVNGTGVCGLWERHGQNAFSISYEFINILNLMAALTNILISTATQPTKPMDN